MWPTSDHQRRHLLTDFERIIGVACPWLPFCSMSIGRAYALIRSPMCISRARCVQLGGGQAVLGGDDGKTAASVVIDPLAQQRAESEPFFVGGLALLDVMRSMRRFVSSDGTCFQCGVC